MEFNVKKIRREKEFTQEDICKRTGLSNTTLIDIEQGRRKNVTIGTLEKIAKALNVSVKDLIKE